MASQKFNILYGRLSQEDDRAGDSNSIVNQFIIDVEQGDIRISQGQHRDRIQKFNIVGLPRIGGFCFLVWDQRIPNGFVIQYLSGGQGEIPKQILHRITYLG